MSRMGAEIFEIEPGIYDWQMVYDHFATRIKKFVRICGNMGVSGEYLTLAEALVLIGREEELLSLVGGTSELQEIRETLFEVSDGDPRSRSLELIMEVLSHLITLMEATADHEAKLST